MASWGIVRVVRVTPDTDLRKIHAYRKAVSRGKLRSGDAVLYVNRAQDKARLIDAALAVHNYYAPEGEVFDVPKLRAQAGALRVRIALTGEQEERAFGEREGKRKVAKRKAAA